MLALAYSGLPHSIEKVFGSAKRISPTGRLPVLALGEERITDSVAILDRLEQLALPRPIGPAEPKARAHDRLWEHYVNDTIYWQGLYMRWCVPENHRRLMNLVLGERLSLRKLIGRTLITREVLRRARGQGIGLKSADQVRAQLVRSLELIEAALPAAGFLAGEAPGRGDFAVAAVTCQSNFRGLTPDMGEAVAARPKIMAHVRAVFAACELPCPV